MSLCLTTSVGSLQDDVQNILRSRTRTGLLKNRVKESRQLGWLKDRHQGTQIFILKMGERSRAVDWYWEIWRELGGELPSRFDISVPSLSTSIRLLIPQEGEEVGNSKQCKQFDPEQVIQTCWEMLQKSIDIEDLKRQRAESGSKTDVNLQLAWKAMDGSLDWVAWSTTVQRKSRNWALLAGVARAQVGCDCWLD